MKAKDIFRSENDETKDNVHHSYNGNENKDLINNIFKYDLKDKDLHLTNFDNRIESNCDNRYLKIFDMIEEEFGFNRSIKNMAFIDDSINTFEENYEPKTKFEIEDKKIACILSKIRCAFLDFYLDINIIIELRKSDLKKNF